MKCGNVKITNSFELLRPFHKNDLDIVVKSLKTIGQVGITPIGSQILSKEKIN